MTFLSCTEDTNQVQWAKLFEQEISGCAEIDDYEEEKKEVEQNQPKIAFTPGLYRMCMAIGARDEEYDKIDDTIPKTDG